MRQITNANCIIALDTVETIILCGIRVRTRLTSAPRPQSQYHARLKQVGYLYSYGGLHRQLWRVSISTLKSNCIPILPATGKTTVNKPIPNDTPGLVQPLTPVTSV